MHAKPVYAATIEQIREEFNLKRRRSAEVLINSSLRRFNSHLAILAIMDSLSPGHETSLQDDADLEKVADIYVGLYRSGHLKSFTDRYLRGVTYGA